MLRRIAPHAALILALLGLTFLTASVWTIGRADIGTTLGLAATGVALLVTEWRIS